MTNSTKKDAEDANINQGTLREVLNRLLVLDSDFDAFCLDYFRDEVWQTLSGGMDRVAKTNILLARADLVAIANKLEERFGDRFRMFQRSLSVQERPVPQQTSHPAVVSPVDKLDDADCRAIGQAILKRAAAILADDLAEFETNLPSGARATVKLNIEVLSDRTYLRKLSDTFELIECIEEEIGHIEKLMRDPIEKLKNWDRSLRKQQQDLGDKTRVVKTTLAAVTTRVYLQPVASG